MLRLAVSSVAILVPRSQPIAFSCFHGRFCLRIVRIHFGRELLQVFVLCSIPVLAARYRTSCEKMFPRLSFSDVFCISHRAGTVRAHSLHLLEKPFDSVQSPSSFFLEKEPGAVGTPEMGPPRHGSPGMSTPKNDWKRPRLKILSGDTMAEKKMPPFLFFMCVPVALATNVLEALEIYHQIPNMFMQE